MEAYSLDLRERIYAACDEGIDSRQEVAERFGVGVWFVQKRLRQRRETGSIAPKPRGQGPDPRIGAAQQKRLRGLVGHKPDATLAELCRELKVDTGIAVSITTMWRTLKALRLPLKKKTLHASERDTPRVRALRGHFKKRIAAVDPRRLVFVDESGINTSMTRTRGRGTPGERVTGSVPQSHWKTLTMIGAVRLDGMTAAVTVDASTDTDVFGTFVHEALVPALRPGDVVVWDNLSSHKQPQLLQELAQAKATLLRLPPYSPDLSPIEPGWSKVKGHVRG